MLLSLYACMVALARGNQLSLSKNGHLRRCGSEAMAWHCGEVVLVHRYIFKTDFLSGARIYSSAISISFQHDRLAVSESNSCKNTYTN